MKENTEEEKVVVPDTEYAVVLVDFIEDLFEKGEKIDGRKKKEREEWKVLINTAIEKVNTLTGHKLYKKC